MASAQDLQPTCEDYDSDQSDQGHVEFRGRASPNAANVSTKRSQASDLNKEKPPAPQDLRSDSGYSSYTAATVSSTNSAQSASSQRSPPAAPSPPAPQAAAVAAHPQAPPPPQPQQQPPPPPKTSRRLTQSDQSRPKLSSRTTSQSSSKPVVKQRRPTVTQDARPPERTRRDSRVDSECTDPKCTSCPPNAIPARLARPGIKPTQSARDVDRVSAADTRSMRSDPATYYPSPPSPNQARRPAAYRQESAIIQPAKAPRRPSASRPRPMSYGGEPNPQYWAQGGMPAPYPSPPQEHGPPLSNSAAWRNMPQYHAGGMPPYGAPQGYPAPYYTHTPPPFDGPQRPGMPARMNSARNGPAPVVTQFPRDQQYSARYNQPQSAVQARFPQPLALQDQAYESESESETGSSDDDDHYYQQPDPSDPRNQRALMAPPKLERTKSKSTSKKQPRPPMRHANTSQVVDERAARRMSLSQSQPQSLVIEEPRRKRASRPSEDLSRRASVSRPAPPRHVQSDYPDHRGQMVVAKSIKAERRRSGQVYEQIYHPDDRRAAERSEAAAKKARALARAEAKRAEEEARYQAEQAEIAERERKRANRNSKQYYREPPEFYSEDESDSEESDEEQFLPEAPVPPPPQARRRRPTDAGNGKGKERKLERKTKRIENEAEEYISARRGAGEPLNDHIHNAARHSRTISMPSHSGSSGSERSRSNRTAITNENNEIRLRVDANAPLSLQFNGDMEGRTLRMIPAENGMADLVISGGRETAYHSSDRGSNADDRKALALRQPRRQAEEMTESSSRPRRRRDSQVIRETRVERSAGQRPLRQRANTSSYYNE